jgi:hypothetical protein
MCAYVCLCLWTLYQSVYNFRRLSVSLEFVSKFFQGCWSFTIFAVIWSNVHWLANFIVTFACFTFASCASFESVYLVFPEQHFALCVFVCAFVTSDEYMGA